MAIDSRKAQRGWMMQAAGLGLAAAMGAGMASAPADAGVIRHDRDAQPYLDLAQDPAYASVGRFTGWTSASSITASGVLIANNWVLTAGHVVDDLSSLRFHLGGESFKASQWIAHPNWTGNLNTGWDLALVRFDVGLTDATGIDAATRYTGTAERTRQGTLVGFGSTGTGLTGSTTSSTRKRAGHNMIDAWHSGSSSRIFLTDFDRPGNTSESTMGSNRPLDLEVMIAPGDSGGGVFINIGGEDLLAGIHSFVWGRRDNAFDSDYGDVGGHIRVSAFNRWIDGVLLGNVIPLTPTNIPEPASVMLFAAGAALLAGRRRSGGAA